MSQTNYVSLQIRKETAQNEISNTVAVSWSYRRLSRDPRRKYPNGNKLFQGLVSLNSQFPLFLFCPQLTPNFLKQSAYGKFTINSLS